MLENEFMICKMAAIFLKLWSTLGQDNVEAWEQRYVTLGIVCSLFFYYPIDIYLSLYQNVYVLSYQNFPYITLLNKLSVCLSYFFFRCHSIYSWLVTHYENFNPWGAEIGLFVILQWRDLIATVY